MEVWSQYQGQTTCWLKEMGWWAKPRPVEVRLHTVRDRTDVGDGHPEVDESLRSRPDLIRAGCRRPLRTNGTWPTIGAPLCACPNRQAVPTPVVWLTYS